MKQQHVMPAYPAAVEAAKREGAGHHAVARHLRREGVAAQGLRSVLQLQHELQRPARGHLLVPLLGSNYLRRPSYIRKSPTRCCKGHKQCCRLHIFAKATGHTFARDSAWRLAVNVAESSVRT